MGSLGAALVYWLGFCYRGPSFWKSLLKTTAIGLLALLSLLAFGPSLVVLALLACGVGDYLLSRGGERAFLGGVAAFALGHVIYAIAILSHPESDLARLFESEGATIAGVLVVLALIMAVVLYRCAGDLRFAVLGYVPLIAGLGIAALSLQGVDPTIFAIFGALMFVFSDFVLALEMFVIRANRITQVILALTVWAFYWSGQYFLMVGLAV